MPSLYFDSTLCNCIALAFWPWYFNSEAVIRYCSGCMTHQLTDPDTVLCSWSYIHGYDKAPKDDHTSLRNDGQAFQPSHHS